MRVEGQVRARASATKTRLTKVSRFEECDFEGCVTSQVSRYAREVAGSGNPGDSRADDADVRVASQGAVAAFLCKGRSVDPEGLRWVRNWQSCRFALYWELKYSLRLCEDV